MIPFVILLSSPAIHRSFSWFKAFLGAMPLSTLEKAKRAFVSLLLLLARSYNVTTHVTRESPAAELLKAFKRVARAVHPDKGGSLVDQQRLNVARDRWQEARSEPRCGAGRPAGGGAADAEGGVGPLLPTASSLSKRVHGRRLCRKDLSPHTPDPRKFDVGIATVP